MVLYECAFCNFVTTIKTHYKRHLNTKKHKNFTNYQDTNISTTDTLPRGKQLTHTDPKMTLQKKTKKKGKKKEYICHICRASLSKNSHLHRHIRSCKDKFTKKVEFSDYNKMVDKMVDKILEQNRLHTEKTFNNTTELIKQATEIIFKNVGNTYNINNTMNNTNYVLNYYNFSDADSMQSILPKFKLTRDEFIKASLTHGYQGALMEKADNVIIKPYLEKEELRPMHTVDLARKKALYKDKEKEQWTQKPLVSLNDCFESFHQSAMEQRDKIILENPDYIPQSNEDSLYKQIYFIPTDNEETENIKNKVKNHIYSETKIKKKKDQKPHLTEDNLIHFITDQTNNA
jgi:hypothetical protein